MENDPLIKDDQAVVLSIKDKGLVVITGCGHSGPLEYIENSIKSIRGQASQVNKNPDNFQIIMGGISQCHRRSII